MNACEKEYVKEIPRRNELLKNTTPFQNIPLQFPKQIHQRKRTIY
jgi:hypothetical protein